MNIELQGISKTYGSARALEGLDLSIEDSKCLALIGPSGGGKSTTLRLLAGIEKPTTGEILIDGSSLSNADEHLREYRKSIGIVFQAYNLFPHYSALENITLPLTKVHGYSEEDSIERARELLRRFHLLEHANKKPAELSGGQNQRVAIARALGHKPKLLMLDEPTSALDPEMTAEVLEVIEELVEGQKDVIIVTHQMGFAKRVADQVAIIADGKVAETGPPNQIFENPESNFTRRFLSRVLKY
ncbi:MAG: amino acid ABC transporter ATP-binding protein [Verrucomicrobiota bacterium]